MKENKRPGSAKQCPREPNMENTGIIVRRNWHYASLLNIYLTTCCYLHKIDGSIMRKNYKFLVRKNGERKEKSTIVKY
jgi:hypothetical protein